MFNAALKMTLFALLCSALINDGHANTKLARAKAPAGNVLRVNAVGCSPELTATLNQHLQQITDVLNRIRPVLPSAKRPKNDEASINITTAAEVFNTSMRIKNQIPKSIYRCVKQASYQQVSKTALGAYEIEIEETLLQGKAKSQDEFDLNQTLMVGLIMALQLKDQSNTDSCMASKNYASIMVASAQGDKELMSRLVSTGILGDVDCRLD